MARSKSGKKKKKEKKPKLKVRKYNLDMFGLLTLTRVHGGPFLDFMTSGGDKKGKGKKVPPKPKGGKGKKGKKGQKEEPPSLPKFDELPSIPIKRRKDASGEEEVFVKEPILPYVNVGYQKLEKTSRRTQPVQRAGSIRDVLCGPRFPLPPRPQPHGGVMADDTCPACKMLNQMMPLPYDKLPKKLRNQMYKAHGKAEFVIKYLTDHAFEAVEYYRNHIKDMTDIMGPAMDALDQSEWDDHFEIRGLVDKWRKLQRELLKIKAEYRHLRDNVDAEIERLLADKQAEVDAAERRLRELELQLKDAIDTLEDWRENKDKKLQNARDEIQRLLELLESTKNSVFTERDYLRDLLAWETQMATEQTVAEMERIIAEDINYMLNWMHPAWFNLVMENDKLENEEKTLNAENRLLELEVETLRRQVNKLISQKKRFEQTKTYGFRPPGLQATVNSYFLEAGKLQLYDYPTTTLVHE